MFNYDENEPADFVIKMGTLQNKQTYEKGGCSLIYFNENADEVWSKEFKIFEDDSVF